MTPLTPKERNFCDHLDYENSHVPGDPGMPIPAISWLNNSSLSSSSDITNILTLRRMERKDEMLPKKPEASFAPAWATGDEAKARNAELAPIVEELRRSSIKGGD